MSEESSSPASDTPPARSALLTFEESRVLGCLLEKEATVPDQYPLTFNSLHAACNQSSNREPVVDFGTDTVEEAMEGLRYKKLSILVHQAGARVPKCKHTIENKYPYLTKGQQAILCVLLLRGPQTVGELRQRTERMHAFSDLERVQVVLEELAAHTPEPIAQLIPAGGGRRAATWMHTLCGTETPVLSLTSESVRGTGIPAASWRTEMEEGIASLRAEITSLREELESIKTNLGL